MSIQVIASVTNDINHDNRVDRICSSLQNNGYELMLVGRKGQAVNPLKRGFTAPGDFRCPLIRDLYFTLHTMSDSYFSYYSVRQIYSLLTI